MIRMRKATQTILMLLSALMLLTAQASHAAGLIRDSETEAVLDDALAPILQAAGQNSARINVHILNARDPNAFVTTPFDIFVTTGLLTKFDDIRQIQAVLAHEMGHILHNHLTQRRLMQSNVQTAGLGGIALGVLVAAAGAPDIGLGLTVGAQSASERALLAHTRAEEASADQTAVNLMRDAGIAPSALTEVLESFAAQSALSSAHTDPYVLTHPPSETRIKYLEQFAHFEGGAQDTDLQARYTRARMKLMAFISWPQTVLERLADQPDLLPVQIAKVVALSRKPDPDAAEALLDQLLKAHPKDAYLWELAGDIRYRAGDLAGAELGYAAALDIRPNDPLIMYGLGVTLAAYETDAANAEALTLLRTAYRLSPEEPVGLRALATVYARDGQNGQAALITAERMILSGAPAQAARYAEIAMRALPEGAPGWIKASDILQQVKRAVKQDEN